MSFGEALCVIQRRGKIVILASPLVERRAISHTVMVISNIDINVDDQLIISYLKPSP